MVIVETSVFTRRVTALLRDDDYRLLQNRLAAAPTAGALIAGSGGLRKLRWGRPGRGKRGGVRVIYYWSAGREQLLMLLIYAKNEQDDLSADELRVLARIVREEYP
jgi:hypothetical protein